MKSTALFLLMMIPLIHLQAQREYLPTPEDLTRFQATRTYVVLSNNPLSEYNFEIRDVVEKYWTLTPYEFLGYDDFAEKSLDKNASFLYVAVVNFEKDKSRNRYMFLCLSLGGERETIDDLKDVTNIPLGYHGVDEDHYTYKMGTLIRFMQNHVQMLIDNPAMVAQNVFQHYNENMAYAGEKTLYLVEDEIEPRIATEAQISKLYHYPFQIVDREKIKELIMAGDKDAIFLHKVGPEGKNLEARTYKILIGVAEARIYYYEYHKVSAKNPDAFLEDDFKRLERANEK
ncbi:MAG: hypothetical protein V2B15_01665 [Bacteroidota bacterium]